MTSLIAGGVILAVLLGFVAYAFIQGRKGGIASVEASVAETEAKAAHAANEAQVNAPRTPDAIDDRLRHGGGL